MSQVKRSKSIFQKCVTAAGGVEQNIHRANNGKGCGVDVNCHIVTAMTHLFTKLSVLQCSILLLKSLHLNATSNNC